MNLPDVNNELVIASEPIRLNEAGWKKGMFIIRFLKWIRTWTLKK